MNASSRIDYAIELLERYSNPSPELTRDMFRTMMLVIQDQEKRITALESDSTAQMQRELSK